MQFISFRILIRRIKAIKSMMRDKTVPKRKKALVVAGIIYLFLPIDLIPPVLFPFGRFGPLDLDSLDAQGHLGPLLGRRKRTGFFRDI